MTVRLTLPLQTKNPTNNRQHWRVVWKRSKGERGTACMLVRAKLNGTALPACVRHTRISAGTLDDDNLRGALKAVRDGVADALGVADNDPRLTFVYGQGKCKRGEFGVRVEIGL